MPVVAVRDISMYYETHGSGHPLIVIGGVGLAVPEMRPLVDSLADRFQVVVLDNRGTGRSSVPRGRYSVQQMAADVLALMVKLEIPHAHVVGISLGSRIALHLALEHPDRVDRIVLISGAARVGGQRGRMRLGIYLARLPVLGAPNPQPFHAMKAQFDASLGYDCTARLGEITKSTLILQGRTDRLALPEMAEETHAGIAGSRLVMFDEGHRLAIEPAHRDVLSTTIADFLA